MSLPKNFKDANAYFTDVLKFLARHSWIYKHANTSYLHANVLQQMPPPFVRYFMDIPHSDLQRFPLTCQPLDENVEEDVKKFRHQLQGLIPATAYNTTAAISLDTVRLPRVSIKKQHEIDRLAKLINGELQMEKKTQKRHIILDFGAGLGYLCEALYRLAPHDFAIIGLEADENRVRAAQERVKQYLPTEASGIICYKQQFIGTAAQENIQKAITELSSCPTVQQTPGGTVTIVGLHACADLSITAMQLFIHMQQVRRLIIMPCCYHKLQQRNIDGASGFHNFPLSNTLRRLVYTTVSENTFLNVPFLRLACQQTSARWENRTPEQLLADGRAMFWRAAMDFIAPDAKVTRLQNRKRTLPRLCTFAQFVQHFSLKKNGTTVAWDGFHENEFYKLLQQYDNDVQEVGVRLTIGLICLQTSLQKLCENLVLYDRICYFEEGMSDADPARSRIHAYFHKLLNEEISPRCYVLVAEKL